LIGSDRPAQIAVMKTTPDVFEEYIAGRIKNIRGYVKRARKDLAVSFSRYLLGFDYQMKQIEHIEHMVKKMRISKNKN
jgi:hypothetical protein